MTLVQGTIVCVICGAVVVGVVGYLVDRYTARREAADSTIRPERRGK
jgi:hypothetical protein